MMALRSVVISMIFLKNTLKDDVEATKAMQSTMQLMSNTETGDESIFPIRQMRIPCGIGRLVFRTNISQTHTAFFTPRKASMTLPMTRRSVN